MSDNHPSGVILAKTPFQTAVQILSESLVTLVAECDFAFRGHGAAVQLFFEAGRYDEDRIDEKLTQSDFNPETVHRFAQHYRWFALEGSVRFPGVDRLCALDAVLYPTLDEKNPACVVFRLDSWFLESVWGRHMDEFHDDAANLLVKLSTGLGAHPSVDGFMTVRLPSLAKVKRFDGEHLRRLLLHPLPVPLSLEEALATLDSGPGLVTGVKSSIVSASQLRQKWPDGVVLQTVNGFSVLSTLVLPPSMADEANG